MQKYYIPVGEGFPLPFFYKISFFQTAGACVASEILLGFASHCFAVRLASLAQDDTSEGRRTAYYFTP